jgi:transposase
MAHAQKISVKETSFELQKLHKQVSSHLRTRIKMLQWMQKGVYSIDELRACVGSSRNAIAVWKRKYRDGGIEALLEFSRGGDYRSGFSATDKQLIEEKLSHPKEAFISFKAAQEWINAQLGTEKEYHAIHKYLKRNFGAKLKVGRKSHVKKDDAVVAVFKKPT